MYPYANVLEKLFEAKVDKDFVEQTLQKLVEREKFIVQNNLDECKKEVNYPSLSEGACSVRSNVRVD